MESRAERGNFSTAGVRDGQCDEMCLLKIRPDARHVLDRRMLGLKEAAFQRRRSRRGQCMICFDSAFGLQERSNRNQLAWQAPDSERGGATAFCVRAAITHLCFL
jgi:hypothetical protein